MIEEIGEYRSQDINIISGALSKAQGSYKALIPNQDVPGGKFANLAAILESVRESLASNGLAFYQYVHLLDHGSGACLLRSCISHDSGQWVASTARIVAGKTFRETFNCIEAYRRLNALLLLGIAPHVKDPLIKDDDGLEQHNAVILENLRKPGETLKHGEHADTISTLEYEKLMHELEGYEEIAKGIHLYYGITSVSDLPKDQYYVVESRIRNLKKLHQESVRR